MCAASQSRHDEIPCLPSRIRRPLFALAHSCPMAQDDVSSRMIARDKKDRADFLTSVHFNFLLHLTKQVVPWCKAPYQTFAILDIRTMYEFIKILDVSKDGLTVSNSLAASLPSASHGLAPASSLLVRGADAGPSETLTKPLDQLEVQLILVVKFFASRNLKSQTGTLNL